ncbi:MAG: hypothetical protein LBJ21_04955 [Acidobacteriota bacterium]|jgi:hypothetical protein|nr:hypothetical protein [Acidobacteriota bacterium]
MSEKRRNISGQPELLLGFARRARILIIGRENLSRFRNKLQFVLITEDISENSRKEILRDFRHYPVTQRYSTEELESFIGATGVKALGFMKSGLAQSLYSSLKNYRINAPGGGKPHGSITQPGAHFP